MKQLTPTHSFAYEGARLNVYHANKGEGLPKHTHQYDHATMCCSGSCVVTKENVRLVLTKESKPINLVGSEWHEIEALEDGTVFVNTFADGKQY
jgi:quercetin dioxygenase-like cupin family protein